MFSIPVKGISQYIKINKTEIALNEYPKWVKKILKTFENNYKKAPFFANIMKIIENTLDQETNLILDLACLSIKNVCNYLGIEKQFEVSSLKFSETKHLEKADRLISICNKLGGSEYINPIGGKNIYTKEYFSQNNIKLSFLKTNDFKYKQFSDIFISNLSIVDVMMFNSPKEISKMLNNYELI